MTFLPQNSVPNATKPSWPPVRIIRAKPGTDGGAPFPPLLLDDLTMPEKSSFSDLAMTELSGLGAETGFESDEATPTMRFSGFVSAAFGLFSWTALVGIGGVVVAILAVIFGAFALRPSREGKVGGTWPAQFGILLGVGFGICGVLLPILKTRTLGGQAEQFVQRYIELANSDYTEVAIELKKDYKNRFSSTMPLRDYYEPSESGEGEGEQGEHEPGESPEEIARRRQYEEESSTRTIRNSGPAKSWVLDRPTRVFHQFGIDRAEVIFKNTETGKLMQFELQYLIDSQDVGQWHVSLVQSYRELIIAKSPLD